MNSQHNPVPFVSDEIDRRQRHKAALKKALLQMPQVHPDTIVPPLVDIGYAFEPLIVPGQRLIVPRPTGLDTGVTSTARIPILSMRLKNLVINNDWYIWVEELLVNITAGTPVPAYIGLNIGPTIGGTDAVAYADLSGSHGHSGSTDRLEFDTARDVTNVVSAGTKIWEDVGPFDSLTDDTLRFRPRTPLLATRNEELVVSAQNAVSGQQTFQVFALIRLLHFPGLPAGS